MEKSVDHETITVKEERKYKENKGNKVEESIHNNNNNNNNNIHWSITEDGIIIAKLTTFIYHKIISSSYSGGLQSFIRENCLLFKDIEINNKNNVNEYRIEHTEVFQQYEKYIDQFLDEFCQNEGFTSKEIYNKVQRAVTEYPGASKNLESLLAATDFNRFVKMMKRKAIEVEAESQEKIPIKTDQQLKSEGKNLDEKWENDEESLDYKGAK